MTEELQDSSLLVSHTMSAGKALPTFRKNIIFSSSGLCIPCNHHGTRLLQNIHNHDLTKDSNLYQRISTNFEYNPDVFSFMNCLRVEMPQTITITFSLVYIPSFVDRICLAGDKIIKLDS